jgi:hypothetical protein
VSFYSLKVFSDGSTSVTSAALEWSVDPNQDGDLSDYIQVLNLSLGSSFSGHGDVDDHYGFVDWWKVGPR